MEKEIRCVVVVIFMYYPYDYTRATYTKVTTTIKSEAKYNNANNNSNNEIQCTTLDTRKEILCECIYVWKVPQVPSSILSFIIRYSLFKNWFLEPKQPYPQYASFSLKIIVLCVYARFLCRRKSFGYERQTQRIQHKLKVAYVLVWVSILYFFFRFDILSFPFFSDDDDYLNKSFGDEGALYLFST